MAKLIVFEIRLFKFQSRAGSRLPKELDKQPRSHFLGKKPGAGAGWLPTSNFVSFGSVLALSWELAPKRASSLKKESKRTERAAALS